MDETFPNYRDILKLELADRMAANPQYSLRALAKAIKISPSLLSDLLKGKKGISSGRAYMIGQALDFDAKKCEYFAGLVEFEAAKSPDHKMAILNKLQSLQPRYKPQSLDVDRFRMISDWYHISILELIHLEDFEFTAKNVCAALGISKFEAEAGIERLMRLNLLTQTPSGKYKKSENYLLASSELPNQALRKYHEQMLKKAVEALSTQNLKEKFVGSETFAFSEEQVKKATELIEDCFANVVKLTETKQKKKQVYHLGIQLFRVTKKENS